MPQKKGPRNLPEDQCCNAKNRTDGTKCKNRPVIGRKRCRLHGGKTLQGMNHPNYRNKGRGAYLPTALQDKYLAALNDPQLLAIDKDIALLDLRMNELASKLDASDMGQLWGEAHSAWLKLEDAQAQGDVPTMREQHGLVGSLIKRAANMRYLWQDIVQTAKDLAQLRITEHKRLVDMEAMMSKGEMLMVIGVIQEAMRQAVIARVETKTAREILGEVQAKVQTMLEGPKQGKA